MANKIDVFGTEVSYNFNEYNKKTKKRKEVEHPFTDAHKRELMHQMDDTDSGEFYSAEVGDKVITGYFWF